jgi:hypothetical protein
MARLPGLLNTAQYQSAPNASDVGGSVARPAAQGVYETGLAGLSEGDLNDMPDRGDVGGGLRSDGNQ